MAFEKLLDNCQALEKTVSVLTNSNHQKQLELSRLQNKIFSEAETSLNYVLTRESDLQQRLDSLKAKKNDLDTEIKQYSDINEKLSDLVAIAQKSDDSDEEDKDNKNNEMSFTITDTLDEFSQIKQECQKASAKVSSLVANLEKDKAGTRNLIQQTQEIVIGLEHSDSVLRLVEQQNKYAEQQFDLIANQIPWEPLTEQYIDELRKSSSQSLRDIAETLQLQKNEIEELTDSLNAKKARKLKVLEELCSELNSFMHTRDEATLIAQHVERRL